MKTIIPILLLLLLPLITLAQITAPDTVCINTPVTISTPDSAFTYAWAFDSVSINQPLQSATVAVTDNNINVTACTIMRCDNGHYYAFSTNHGNELVRLDYGSNPNSTTPVVANLGNLGGAINSSVTEDIDIVKDAPGMWYGFIADGPQLVRVNFGTSLANTPTATVFNLTSAGVSYGMQISIMRNAGQWIGFLGNYGSNNIVRLDFGTALTNTPTCVILPNYNYLTSPAYFALHEQAGNWYMIVTNLNGNNIVRYDFGTNLQNNAPTAVNLGDPGNLLNYPRGITFIQSCDSFYGIMINEGTTFFKMDFHNDITNTPVMTSIGALGIPASSYGIQTLESYWYLDSLFLLAAPFSGNTIYRIAALGLPAGGISSYTSNQTVHTFTTLGLHHLTVYCDQAAQTGVDAFCKAIYVSSGNGVLLGNDTGICQGASLAINASPGATGYLWSTGSTMPFINVTTGGKYWVITTGSSTCNGSDTINVEVNTIPITNLGNDTAICPRDSLWLTAPQAAGYSYKWNTASTNDSIKVFQAGTYWLAVNNGGCIAADTIHIQMKPAPQVSLGPDTAVCPGQGVQFSSSYTYTSPVYRWSTGASTPTVTIIPPGIYWLGITQGGCTTYDTVLVTNKPAPVVNLGNDTSICTGDVLTLSSTQPSGATYQWNNSTTNTSMQVSQAGTYWLTVTNNNCIGTDTIHVQVKALPQVVLGPDTAICQGQTILLTSSIPYTNPTYQWSTGSTMSSISATQAGTYRLTVKENGCIGSDTITIALKPTPGVVLGIDTFMCKNSSLVLQPENQSPGAVYTWSNGNTGSSITVADAGTYWVTATEDGCSATDTIDVIAKDVVAPFNIGADTSLCSGRTLTLYTNAVANTYTWSDGSTDPIFTIDHAGIYYLSVTNECGTRSDTIDVAFTICNIVLPDAFTPNGDGLNDIFRVLGSLNRIDNFAFSIYNRWGQRVFYTTDKYQGWDGRFNGTPQSGDVFNYMLKYDLDNNSNVLSGNVTLIR